MAEVAELKQITRKQASKKRKAIYASFDTDIFEVVADHFITQVLPEARIKLGKRHLVISGFLPIGSEIDLRPLMARLESEEVSVALPCVVAKEAPLVFRRWKEGDLLVREEFGTTAPTETAERLYPDLLLVPMLAFDKAGFRLGYGGGFYDRSLEELRQSKMVFVCGAAFSEQEIDAVPRDHFDQPLDFLLTEQDMRQFNKD